MDMSRWKIFLTTNKAYLVKNEDGYFAYARLGNIRKPNSDLYYFSSNNNYVGYNLELFIKNHANCLRYVSYKVKKKNNKSGKKSKVLYVEVECSCCKDKWWVSFGNLKYNTPTACPKCTHRLSSEKQMLNLDKMNSITKANINIYKYSKVEWEKSYGYKVSGYCSDCDTCFINAEWKKIRESGKCPECRRRDMSFSIIDVDRFVKSKNKDLYINLELSYYYNDMSTIVAGCLKCGHEWHTYYTNLKSSCGCPRCRLMNTQGYLNTTSAENNRDEWLNIKSTVYIIRCWNENECFYKIGRTDRSIEDRFRRKYEMPYSFEVIKEIITNKYQSLYVERDLHKINNKFWYKPNILFGGYTECFSKLKLNEINSYIEEYNL